MRVFSVKHQTLRNLAFAEYLWERVLLAIAVYRAKRMSPDTPSSRAGSLPHWIFSEHKCCRYTLLDHDRAFQRLMDAALAQNVEIVVGGPYSSGILAGGAHFEYQKASPAIINKVEQIKRIAAAHGVDVKAAALQFSLANPAVAAVIPGSSRPDRIAEDVAALSAVIPAAFWQAMREAKLVSERAPLPLIGA
ncbi:Pyridoxal 4-dehydrogenase [compost metagenome]